MKAIKVEIIFENCEVLEITDMFDIIFKVEQAYYTIQQSIVNGGSLVSFDRALYPKKVWIAVKALEKYSRLLMCNDIVFIEIHYDTGYVDKIILPCDDIMENKGWFTNRFQTSTIEAGQIVITVEPNDAAFCTDFDGQHEFEILKSLRPEKFEYKKCKYCPYIAYTSKK